jgi:hypothetical protein
MLVAVAELLIADRHMELVEAVAVVTLLEEQAHQEQLIQVVEPAPVLV